MPLSHSEKSRRYRDKLKRTNPEKYLEMKNKNKMRATKAYLNKKKALADAQEDRLSLLEKRNSSQQTVRSVRIKIQSTSSEQSSITQDHSETHENENNRDNQNLTEQLPDRQNEAGSSSNMYLNRTARNIVKKVRAREYVQKLIRDYISLKREIIKLKRDFRDFAKKVQEKEAECNAIKQEQLEESDSQAQDDVWSFFERAGGEARCAVCRALVPISELRRHLRANHPKLVDIEESEEETSANNAQEEVYTEVVYVENEENHKKTPKTIEKPRKPKQIKENSAKKRRASSSSDEEPLQHKKTKHDDEIVHFTKYITCLLKKIPRETCMELQMEIVNLIMKKQLELKRNETSVLAAKRIILAGNGSKMEAIQSVSETAKSFEIKINDDNVSNNGYSYSIENIVNDETVRNNEQNL